MLFTNLLQKILCFIGKKQSAADNLELSGRAEILAELMRQASRARHWCPEYQDGGPDGGPDGNGGGNAA